MCIRVHGKLQALLSSMKLDILPSRPKNRVKAKQYTSQDVHSMHHGRNDLQGLEFRYRVFNIQFHFTDICLVLKL